MTEMTSRSVSSAQREPYTAQYDRLDDTPLSVAVAQAVAMFRTVDVMSLDPLHHAINADALERLFEPRADSPRTGGTVSFEYNDCLVTVTADGEIRVQDA
ncbi:HalOD1 output domain-containing protein [Natronolimnobius baerhuensis]|uniref:Halobacterial output domain-containing protein n=1 Tax=Natronolimnobius baerhuensis TaxID=253108 RepID=A0A202E4N7_9EURY|nr:HalOD1 output domain-containing protein [Natronolimnobius baerhuensis]OVE83164.1 hypothetical protein B2G88_17295 [Natronolimnobius baerhuensis]